MNSEIIQSVYLQLKERKIHPSGSFDKAGRWFADRQEAVAHIRSPSRAYPYSEMVACRTKKYVRFVQEATGAETEEALLLVV